jgi:hypothetical protein
VISDMTDLMAEIESILRRDPTTLYSKEEILNLLASKKNDSEIERLLAELEVAGSLKENKSDVYSICRGGTVYYKWNKS